MRIIFFKCRAFKIKSVLFLTVCILTCFLFLKIWFINSKKPVISSVKLQNVIVHIDLKGTPLKITYLESLLPLMKQHGVTGLLMEYEDMFPYEGKLANLSAEYCYSKTELKNFLTTAKNSGFEIIPLVQTFGHMEYALKLEEFTHLREVAQNPGPICLSKQESQHFLAEMIQQIMDFHSAVSPLKFLHIGFGKVYHFNECDQCTAKEISHLGLFLKHVKFLENVVKTFSEETKVLIWDDMLRNIEPTQWEKIVVFENIHPVCWDYRANVQVTHQELYQYHERFPHIWIATAYKGADGRTASLPDIKNRFLNHFNYLKFILGYKFGGDEELYNFEGIILTGWSRYSHMEPPCELLPVSIPSLVVSLLVIQKFQSGISDIRVNDNEEYAMKDMFNNYIIFRLNKSFKCSISIDNFDFTVCKFEAKELYKYVIMYYVVNTEILMSINDDNNLIAAYEYYSRLGMINMNTLLQVRGNLEFELDKSRRVGNLIILEMKKFYHTDFIMEYVNYKGWLTKTLVMKVINSLDKFKTQRPIWKRRIATNESISGKLHK